MQNKIKSQPEIAKVTDPKFGFELSVKGTWDWNRDIAGAVPGNGYDSSFISPYNIKKSDTLHKAFLAEMSAQVFDRCDNMFETVSLVKTGFTADMNAAYADVRAALTGAALTGADRLAAEAELKAAEEKAARLRKQLGK